MKKFLFVLAIFLIPPVLLFGYLGFIPGVSSIFGASKPRNLNIVYSEADLASGRQKSAILYEEAVGSNTLWQTFGSREVNTAFSSAEITAIMNNKPGIYYPYKDVQVKLNSDGSAEISGRLIKDRIPAYASTFDAPQQAVDFAMKFLPSNPVFYVKGKASLENNQVATFAPQALQIGKMPIPLGPILSFNSFYKQAFAQDTSMLGDISKVSGKRQLIIDFINSRLEQIEGFYAKDAHFEENKLIFKGTLPEREATLR